MVLMTSRTTEGQPTAEPPGPTGLAEAVNCCRQSRPFLDGLAALYAEVDRAVARTGARCMGGGMCCKFDLAGVRLYLTAGELAALSGEPPPNTRAVLAGRCPYQAGPRCAARIVRPLGCRIFFCGPATGEELTDVYELFHRRLCELHQTHCLPYAYVDAMVAFLQLFSRK